MSIDKSDNVIHELSFNLAVQIIKLYRYLRDEKECVISKQVLRSGTSIGANVRKSIYAQDSEELIRKLSVALKDADETKYWLELLYASQIITGNEFKTLTGDTKKLIGALMEKIEANRGHAISA